MCCFCLSSSCTIFFFNATATNEIYTLSLHDALPILIAAYAFARYGAGPGVTAFAYVAASVTFWSLLVVAYDDVVVSEDRKSTRLNSSHANISYAVFCLKKKKIKTSG